jgi:RNA-dependent RNA polymerase
MISVDYELEGHIVCVRPSMDKFDGRNSRDIEIANVLDRPLRMYLNRPLIAILETLGVPADEFVRLQRMAIEATRNAAVSISASAELLENHGLGASFRLPGILKYLAKNTESSFDMLGSSLASQSMGFAVVHILRDLMHRARIPVGGSCTLVGIADIHGYLKECEIFGDLFVYSGWRRSLIIYQH